MGSMRQPSSLEEASFLSVVSNSKLGFEPEHSVNACCICSIAGSWMEYLNQPFYFENQIHSLCSFYGLSKEFSHLICGLLEIPSILLYEVPISTWKP